MNMRALSGLQTLGCVVLTKTSQQRFQSLCFEPCSRRHSWWAGKQVCETCPCDGDSVPLTPPPLPCTLSCRPQGPTSKSGVGYWVSLLMRGFKASPRIMETEPVGPVTSQRPYCLTHYMTLGNKDSDSVLRCLASDNFQASHFPSAHI